MEKAEKKSRDRPVGRPKGTGRRSSSIMGDAKLSGELPHEFMLRIMRGGAIQQKRVNPETGEYEDTEFYPAFKYRLECAKYAAPYFAAKLAHIPLLNGETPDMGDIIKEFVTILKAIP